MCVCVCTDLDFKSRTRMGQKKETKGPKGYCFTCFPGLAKDDEDTDRTDMRRLALGAFCQVCF